VRKKNPTDPTLCGAHFFLWLFNSGSGRGSTVGRLKLKFYLTRKRVLVPFGPDRTCVNK
jgi:hypothetical protein